MKKYFGVIMALMILSFVSCKDDNDGGNAVLNVRLTDAPGDYDKVKVDIQDVQINVGEEEKGWTSVGNVNKGVYDLLEFTAGKDTLLTYGSLPAGNYNQIRLILGENNSVVVNGTEHAIKVPSGQQSGLKLLVNQTLEEGVSYNAILDFDAAKSIVDKGNGTYSLKPTIRLAFEAQSGAISGKVQEDAEGVVYAVQSTDTISTYLNEGAFLFSGVEPGAYKVVVEPSSESTYGETVLVESITVELGKTSVVENNELATK